MSNLITNRHRNARESVKKRMIQALEIVPIHGLPEIREKDDIATLLSERALPKRGDIVVIAQKIISKAEGRKRRLSGVTASQEAHDLAAICQKDPRLVTLILAEATSVIACAPGVLIVEHRSGHIMANAGIDASNLGQPGDEETQVLLLPVDADASAKAISQQLGATSGFKVPVVISDSFGRPWRQGTTGVALGCYGVPAIADKRGQTDRDGRILEVSQVAMADSIAAAAVMVMGEADESVPAVLVRGLAQNWNDDEAGMKQVFRPKQQDLFR